MTVDNDFEFTLEDLEAYLSFEIVARQRWVSSPVQLAKLKKYERLPKGYVSCCSL